MIAMKVEGFVMGEEIRKQMALFPIGTVMKLTGLSARQIRYYEQHQLVQPTRTAGNQRLYSFQDVERLLEIKSLIGKGLNIAGIKQVMQPVHADAKEATVVKEPAERRNRELTDPQVHRLLKRQLSERRPGQVSLIEGQLARYFRSPNHRP